MKDPIIKAGLCSFCGMKVEKPTLSEIDALITALKKNHVRDSGTFCLKGHYFLHGMLARVRCPEHAREGMDS